MKQAKAEISYCMCVHFLNETAPRLFIWMKYQ